MTNSRKKNAPLESSNSKTTNEAYNMNSYYSVKSFALISILLSLAALGGTFYIGWRGMAVESQLPDTTAKIQNINNKLSHQSIRLASTNEDIDALKYQDNNRKQQGERLRAHVDQLSAKFKSLGSSAKKDWHLAEIEYLLKLANQQLHMTSDIISAKKLLASADGILRTINDYSLFNVREALAEDIATLNAVPEFDQESTYLRLRALGEQIDLLPLLEVDKFTPTTKGASDQTQKSSPENTTNWYSKALSSLLYAWNNFASLFRFTTSNERPIEILPTPKQESVIRQNLKLLIEQSKLSLLTRQQTIYKDSLVQAKNWINQYFSRNNSASQAALKTLSSLAMLNINPQLPIINKALKTLSRSLLQSDTQKKNPDKHLNEHLDSGIKNVNFRSPIDVEAEVNNESRATHP